MPAPSRHLVWRTWANCLTCLRLARASRAGDGKHRGCSSSKRTSRARFSGLQVVNGPELLSETVGDSEASTRGLFVAARALAPAVVFLDEVDALAPARAGMAAGGAAGHTSETAARVLSTLLTEMEAPRAVGQRCATAAGRDLHLLEETSDQLAEYLFSLAT